MPTPTPQVMPTPTPQVMPTPTPQRPTPGVQYKRGGAVKKMASGGMTSKVSSASKRGDGIAQRGKTKGRYI
jgi:glutamate 5-kinase